MAETSLQTAAQTLLDHFGPRLEAGQEEGRKRMAEALHERLDIAEHDAKTLVDDLIQAHTIRWMNRRAQDRSNVDGAPLIASAMAQNTEHVFGAVFDDGGYWQLGDEGAPT